MSGNFEYDAAFYEAFEEEQCILKKVLPAGKKYFFCWESIQESGHQNSIAPIISTRTQSRIPHEWAESLEAIVTRSTGYDHLTAYYRETHCKAAAAYLPDYAGRAVAEQAMMMWTVLLRNLNSQQKAFKTFFRDGLTGREIRNRTIAVFGVGRIGTQIVDVANGLGMKVLGVDIAPRQELREKYGLEYVNYDEALKKADIVVCALPLTDITRGWLNKEVLGLVSDGAVFVNIARGEISPLPDLLELLDSGRLSGVGLDVYDFEKELASVLRDGWSLDDISVESRESVESVLKMMKRDDCVLTPHNAFNTEESVERKSIHTAENLSNYFNEKMFLTPCPF